MKYLIPVFFLFFVKVGAQSDLQFIKIKNLDRTVDLSVINHTDSKFAIQVKIEMVDMTFDGKVPMKLEVEPRTTTKIGRLSPVEGRPGKYVISYKATDMEVTPYTYIPNITIYTKNKHKRSTQLLIYLNKHGIAYNEINTSYNRDSKDIYLNMLSRRQIEVKKAKIPVVIYKGDVYYDIKNVKKFCEENFKGEGHFIKKKDRKY